MKSWRDFEVIVGESSVGEGAAIVDTGSRGVGDTPGGRGICPIAIMRKLTRTPRYPIPVLSELSSCYCIRQRHGVKAEVQEKAQSKTTVPYVAQDNLELLTVDLVERCLDSAYKGGDVLGQHPDTGEDVSSCFFSVLSCVRCSF